MSADPKKVFIIHGRNMKALAAVKDLLRAVHLDPLQWEQARSLTRRPNPVVWEIVEAGFNICKTAVVILTGDDEVRLRRDLAADDEDAETFAQSRPNVLIELGAALARGKDSVVIVQVGPHRAISDISGFHLCHLRSHHRPRRDFVARMKDAGAELDDSGSDYLDAGDFDGAVVHAPAAIAASE